MPPRLVISPLAYNRRAILCLACLLTNQAKGYPFEVPIPSGLAITGVVLADQVRSLSWPERTPRLMARADDPALLDDVREKIAALIGIE